MPPAEVRDGGGGFVIEQRGRRGQAVVRVEGDGVDGRVAPLRRRPSCRTGSRCADQKLPAVVRDGIGAAVVWQRGAVAVVRDLPPPGGRRVDQVQARVGVLVDSRDDASFLRIRGEAVALSGDVPLRDHTAGLGQLDDGAPRVAVDARLSLWPDAILKAHEQLLPEPRDVVGVGQLLGTPLPPALRCEGVLEHRAGEDSGHMEDRALGAGVRRPPCRRRLGRRPSAGEPRAEGKHSGGGEDPHGAQGSGVHLASSRRSRLSRRTSYLGGRTERCPAAVSSLNRR